MEENGGTPSAVVIDCGSLWSKAGFAGQDLPSCVVPSVVGVPRRSTPLASLQSSELHAGETALRQRDSHSLSLRYPIEHGIVTNWDHMETLWRHIFCNELSVAPEDHPVLTTEVPAPKANREKMTEIMFEVFNVPAFCVALQALLSLYASGRTTGVAVECGEGVVYSVPVYEGYSLPHAILRLDIAGCDLTDSLLPLLYKREQEQEQEQEQQSGGSDGSRRIDTVQDRATCRDIKESMCYVALDYEQELLTLPQSTSLKVPYLLPDGSVLNLSEERFRCGEALFRPSLLAGASSGYDMRGLHELIFNSIQRCDFCIRQDMFNNIVLSGGTSMFAGVQPRLKRELMRMTSGYGNDRDTARWRPRVHAPLNRKYGAWVGGSLMASLDSFRQLWITKLEYDEAGPSIVHRKCF
ncbi:actin [Balamuthia mandrillaris]